MEKKSRLILGSIIFVLTILTFAYYLSHHTNLLHRLGQTSPVVVIWLLLLYVGWFVSVALMVQATIKLCRKNLPNKDNLLLNAYSTLVNFFVPGQGGIVVRGIYLKRREKLPYRAYIFATLISYGMYAAISVFLLFGFSRPWWQTLLALAAVFGLSALILRLYEKRKGLKASIIDWHPQKLVWLLFTNFLQVVFLIIIYAVELHSVNPHVSLTQSITYTGAANFALFVALTPGAIGIRESFLLLSQHLHHISSANIVAASIIDRSVFVFFLAILFIATVGFHAKDKLKLGDALRLKAKSEISA